MNQFIFQEQQELVRLDTQNRLMYEYEYPVIRDCLQGKSGLKVLDIGCNDGRNTVTYFSEKEVSRVIGIEYNEELVLKAQKTYGNDRFSFYLHDAEASDFSAFVERIMAENGIERFDVIYLSFVLMHLSDPVSFLKQIRSFLAPDGILLICESYDTATALTPDPDCLLDGFLAALAYDIYAGNRTVGAALPDMLTQSGYTDMRTAREAIIAHPDDLKKKEDMFAVFFSYLGEDLMLLQSLRPQESCYGEQLSWLSGHYDALHDAVMKRDARFSIGIRVLVCRKGEG